MAQHSGSSDSPPAATATMQQEQQQQPSSSSESPESYEAAHVHSVYQSIAPHFSATRHKPWPFITTFLGGRAPGSLGLDVGCGNGKYLPVNPKLHILASDRSPALLALARDSFPGAQLAVADTLCLPYRPRSVDFVICIAVVHHLSTRDRRRAALAEMLACVRDGGECLVYVWALEQSSSRRGWDVGSDQDTLVPWVMRVKGQGEGGQTYQRYYHLYRKGELEEDIAAAGGHVLQSGYERDNWWCIFGRVP